MTFFFWEKLKNEVDEVFVNNVTRSLLSKNMKNSLFMHEHSQRFRLFVVFESCIFQVKSTKIFDRNTEEFYETLEKLEGVNLSIPSIFIIQNNFNLFKNC